MMYVCIRGEAVIVWNSSPGNYSGHGLVYSYKKTWTDFTQDLQGVVCTLYTHRVAYVCNRVRYLLLLQFHILPFQQNKNY